MFRFLGILIISNIKRNKYLFKPSFCAQLYSKTKQMMYLLLKIKKYTIHLKSSWRDIALIHLFFIAGYLRFETWRDRKKNGKAEASIRLMQSSRHQLSDNKAL